MLGRKKFPHVLLLHAGGLDGRMWHPLAERLKDSYRLHMPDLRGHGETPMPTGEEFSNVDDVLRLLNQLNVKRAVVVGASFGGRVALQLATAAPERVSALGLLATSLPKFDRLPELQAFNDEEDALWDAGDIDAVVELNVRTWVHNPEVADLVADMVRTACERQAGVEADERELPVDLGAIAVPTLAVSGGLDFPDFARIADRVTAEVPNAERAEIADAGHLIALERPDETTALLRSWLERVGA
jgi:3-oxoadipate enol-lactonase